MQYASTEYVDELKYYGFIISIWRKGNPYYNAQTESFFKALKYEEVYLFEYETIEAVRERLPYFIEEVYTQKRLHTALDYQSPNDFEKMLFIQRSSAAHRQTLLILSGQSCWCIPLQIERRWYRQKLIFVIES